MHLLNIPISHSDERGFIQDLLVDTIDSITRISFAQNAIRGNHVHRETTQWTYILKGQIQVATTVKDELVLQNFETNQMFVSLPNEPHAMRALVPAEILVFTRGPRSGASFESDTFRVELIK